MKNQENKQTNVFAKMEEEVLDFWEKSKIFEKSVKKEAPNGDYVFYDGPPFITGLPHYATLLPSIAKDVVPRYWTMKGYRVERVWGWDCHGLPAENRVEGELKLKNKKDIEELGVDKFVDACRNYVTTGSEQWKWYIDRIGRWVDMDNAYKTMDLNFMESVIWAFKILYDKGLIYEGYRTSLHCPRCATPLSKFEITMDAGSYKDVTDETVIVKFKLKNQENTYILAWTTTPWTLPGNLALAVGTDIDYAIVLFENDKYILAKDKLEEVFENKKFEVLEIKKGKDLVGLEYEPIFDLENEKIKNNEKLFKVYSADFVNTEDGTGIVHIAPNFGEDDFNLSKANDFPMFDLMDENGVYTEEAGHWAGVYFKKAGNQVLESLSENIFSQKSHTHSYPFCYRCNTRLIYKTQKAWYLKISEIRQKMLDNNKKDINWMPEYFKEGRFHNNIENAPDWCLSRSRYWGSPIPVWKCEACNEIKVVGSIQEIEELSGEKILDLHRPNIDKPEFVCTCGAKMKRVKEVFDCWFESGSMPFAQFHYPFKRKEEWPNIFPADFIIEYTGQLRGWFYYLHVLANALFDSVAFKNVIVTGVLAGTDGRKMSKSYGNYPDPRMTIDKYGADALRMYFMASPIMTGGDMNMLEKDIQDSLRKNIIILWNVVNFYSLFSKDLIEENEKLNSKNILDHWIKIELLKLKKEVTINLEKYDLPSANRPITSFIDDLSTWYIRRSRDRFKGDDEADKQSALQTTKYVLLELSKIIAPFMPFIAEQVWQKITNNNFQDQDKSVHLEAWSDLTEEDEEKIKKGKEVSSKMNEIKKIIELALAKRDEEKIKIRQPLNKLTVNNSSLKIDNDYLDLIKDEVNIKEIEIKEGQGNLEVELDLEITQDLKLEGLKREIVRFINSIRKETGLTINDNVVISYETKNNDLKNALEKFENEIKKETLALEIKEGIDEGFESRKEVKVNGESLVIGLLKK